MKIMKNGVKEALRMVTKIRLDKKREQLLRRGVYALGNLMSNEKPKTEEAFNGFKDELTDYSKYRNKGLSM